MITKKKYACPTCGWKYTTETNHFGEIYRHCSQCDSSVLYCLEPEAKELLVGRQVEEALLAYYYYDLTQPEDAKRYDLVLDYARDEKLNKWERFQNIGCRVSHFFKAIRASTRVVNVYDRIQFNDQFVTSLGRLHKWDEAVYPNKNIKEGYFLKFL
jgi:hypothetical protein